MPVLKNPENFVQYFKNPDSDTDRNHWKPITSSMTFKQKSMSTAHLHLLITHLPIFGSLCGIIVLYFALWKKSEETLTAAYWILVLSAVGAGIAYASGEGAEEKVEHLQGVLEHSIARHEEMAGFAAAAFILVGAVSITGLLMSIRGHNHFWKIAWLTLVVSLIALVLAGRTGYLGGKIRHTEINGAYQAAPVIEGKEGETEDD